MAQKKSPASRWFSKLKFRGFFSDPVPEDSREEQNLYLQELVFQHRSFDVKGIAAPGEATLPLAELFVDVGLSSAPQRVSANPIPAMHKSSTEARYSIWHFLELPENGPPQNLVVLGAPGTGKTTLLKHLTLSLAQTSKGGQQLNKCPIFLSLRDLAPLIQQTPNLGICQAAEARLRGRQIQTSLVWLEDELMNGRCLIMLDGLDEVADRALRQRVVAWVQRQIMEHTQNQFIITSRPFGYTSNPLPHALLLEVKPFTIEQIRQFVQNWFLANELQAQGRNDLGVQRDAAGRAADLLQRLHQAPALLEMGINPLLLTMITTIHHYRSSLPDQRVALYREICDVFLGKRQQARGIRYTLTASQKKRVLQTLAYEMMCRNQQSISEADAADLIDWILRRVHPQSTSSDFLKTIANTSGLLVEHAQGVYSFAHLTFQEYLAAVHIKEEQLEPTLLTHVDNAWWHETIRLYAAQTDASNIIRACVMRQSASIPALTLAVECLDEAQEVDDDFRRIPGELLRSIDDDNPEIRRIGAEVRLLLRLRNLVRLDETTYADSTLVTQAEYQLFLDEMRSQGRYRQPDHWAELQFSKGAGRRPVAGVRPSDARAFCHWLSERDPGPWRYRLPTAQEISRPPHSPPESNDAMPIGYWFQNNGRSELAPVPRLQQDRALFENLQRQLEQKLLNDLLAFKGVSEVDEGTRRLRAVILERARRRAFSLLDLDRRLPFAGNAVKEIGHYFNLVQDRDAEGMASDMEQALFLAKTSIDNPNTPFLEESLLEGIIEIGNRLLISATKFSLSDRVTQLLDQLMQELNRARNEMTNAEHRPQSQFLTHRELVRHINNALLSAQNLLDELAYTRTDARIRLRVTVLHRSLRLLQGHSQPQATEETNPRLERRQILQLLVDLYVDIAILENRDRNKMMALEGIRIFRETTTNS